MIHTPLGSLDIQIDGKSIPYWEIPKPMAGAISVLTARYTIPVTLAPDGCGHTVSCRIVGYLPTPRDTDEGEAPLALRSFFCGRVKLSLGMEGKPCEPDSMKRTVPDYETDLLPDGVQYRTFPETKRKYFLFGVSWMNDATEETSLATRLGANPASEF